MHFRVNRATVRWYAGSTSSLGRFRLVPEVPRGRPAVPGDSGLCPRARGFDQVYCATWVLVRRPTGWTSCPGRLRPWSKGLRGRPAVPGQLGLVFEGSRGRPSVPGYSGPCLRARSVDQVTRATRFGSECPRGRPAVPGVSARVRETAWSTSSLGLLGPVSEGSQFRPTLPGESRSGPMAHGVDQLSGATRAIPDSLRGRRAVPGYSGLCQGPVVSTSCPRQLGPMSEVPRFPSALPGESGLGPMGHCSDQLSGVIRACARGPARSTSCPG